MIGPEAGDSSWTDPLKKYLRTAQQWGKVPMGLQFATVAYGVYILPILSYVAQLEAPPEHAFELEKKVLSIMVPGPYRWILDSDLFQIGEAYGQQRSFPSLRSMAEAAQFRTLHFENAKRGGLHVRSRQMESRRWCRESPFLERKARWHNWFDHSPARILEDNADRLGRIGITKESTIALIHRPSEEDLDERTLRKIKKGFQRAVRVQLDSLGRPHPETRMRHKLERWELASIPRITASRCLQALRLLRQRVAPRVCAAVLRTMWNGWPTARRFQCRRDCLFHCGGWLTEDSIEHYAVCPTAIHFGRAFLGISQIHQPTPVGNLVTLGLNYATVADEDIVTRGIYIYALYRTMCTLNHGEAGSWQEVHDMLCQFARQANDEGEDPHIGSAEEWEGHSA